MLRLLPLIEEERVVQMVPRNGVTVKQSKLGLKTVTDYPCVGLVGWRQCVREPL